ncbi:TetR/AcrR family transcriptional regulator [Pseudaminobacter salicylatoxidans]|uniref:TetR/AcrR family transcriptional regulator n=1 Tax=Pseudaminobacter salicylatoxidans TaxID=93369 RepID=UPI00036BE52A|nr:TetR/AcrR family transcriptional regulator [Pseudaminobacter salicylatoxidans]
MLADAGKEATCIKDPVPKERIFRAVMSVALRQGFGKVTLRLVARDAGLSKGGLLYHFATKNDLISSMLEYYANLTACHPRSVYYGEADVTGPGCNPFAVAVLIAAAENPLLLEPFGQILQSAETGTIGKPTQRPLPLLGNLANRLCLGAKAAMDRQKNAPTGPAALCIKGNG